MPSIPAGLRYCDWLWSTGAPGRNLAPNLRERTFHRGSGRIGSGDIGFPVVLSLWCAHFEGGSCLLLPRMEAKDECWVILSCLQLHYFPAAGIPFSSRYLKDIPRMWAATTLIYLEGVNPSRSENIPRHCADVPTWGPWRIWVGKNGTCIALPKSLCNSPGMSNRLIMTHSFWANLETIFWWDEETSPFDIFDPHSQWFQWSNSFGVAQTTWATCSYCGWFSSNLRSAADEPVAATFMFF